jgi:hypothetical protein
MQDEIIAYEVKAVGDGLVGKRDLCRRDYDDEPVV